MEGATLRSNGRAATIGSGDPTSLCSDHSVSKNASEFTGKVSEEPKGSRSHKPLTVYRLVRGIVCLITLVSTAFVTLIMLAPVVFVIIRAFAVHTSRKLTALVFGQWLALWPYLFEKINGTSVIFSGDRVPNGERVMVMCNHRTEVDWMYIWNLALRKGRIGSCKYALKSSVRNVPIFGWAFHVLEFLLLDRNWEQDESVIESYLRSFRNHCDPFWFILFPEGTDFTEQKLLKGNNYAKQLGLPGNLQHVLLPRTRGFVACMPLVHGSLDAVYDLTMAYKYRCPLFVDNLFGIDPAEVHINIRRIPMEEVPTSEEEASSWLYDCFYQKDKLLIDFHRDGCFPNPIHEGELDTRAFLLRLALFIISTVAVLRYALFQYSWLQVYVASSVVLLSAVTFFNYKTIPADNDDEGTS